jgi:predicted phosphodiesterase
MRFIVLGDTHGDLDHLDYAIKRAHESGCEEIFQVGDWGYLWPRQDKVELVHERLSRSDLRMRFIEGNHDWYVELMRRGCNPQGDSPKALSDRITYYPRGYSWMEEGVRFLTLGGAYSVDRELRAGAYIDWWPEEDITYADIDRAIENGQGAHVVLAHEAPPSEALRRLLIKYGLPLRADIQRASEASREALRVVVEALAPQLLVHGHYHIRYTTHVGVTRVEGLAHNKWPDSSYLILDTEGLGTGVNDQ